MNALLDTHTIIFAVFLPQRLTRTVCEILDDQRNTLFVSAASAWEIATKVRSGKLPEARLLELDFEQKMYEAGYTLLSIDVATALRAGRLVGEYRDPFDRMLAAQALAMDMPLISSDAQLDQFGIRRIW